MKKTDSQHKEESFFNGNVIPLYRISPSKHWTRQIFEKHLPFHPSPGISFSSRSLNSLSKKRLLKIWEKKRVQVEVAHFLPELIEKLIYYNVYKELSPLFAVCYREDLDLPYTAQTLLSWVHSQKEFFEQSPRNCDAAYWEEIARFIEKCVEYELIEDLHPYAN
jgi:hypothetical protein